MKDTSGKNTKEEEIKTRTTLTLTLNICIGIPMQQEIQNANE